ncbi:MAG: hypothetical protein JXD23_06630 [Spirochaetales bacterium]|nr:hypothetical protein [Spirochaetales bacterium]
MHFFSSDGHYETSFDFPTGMEIGTISDIALQEDGKIVGVGIDLNRRRQRPCVLRLSSVGKADKSFNKSGFVTIESTGILNSVTVGKNQKILACGSLIIDGHAYPFVVRLSADGDVDFDFYKKWASNKHNAYMDRLNAEETEIATDADGKIVVCGFVNDEHYHKNSPYSADDAVCDLIVNRYTADGKADSTFGDAYGQKRLQFPHYFAYRPSMGIVSRGGIVLLAKICKSAVPERDFMFALAKLVP